MLVLTPTDRRALKARAHALKPVVWIGTAGLSETVLHELDQGLKSHELIKVKVASDEWEIRNALLEEICGRLEAAPVQHIGKMLVIYRPEPENTTPDRITGRGKSKESKEKKPAPRPARTPRISHRTRRSSSRSSAA